MLYFNLAPILAARGIINATGFLVKAGLTYHTAANLLHKNYRQPRLDHVELLCKALVCTPNDILAWRPGEEERLPDNHPLTTLAPRPTPALLVSKLKNLTLDKLSEINSLIDATLNAPPAD